MAIASVSRWQVIRDVICNQKSGTLVLQLGQHYLHWQVESGNIISVQSTFPEQSFSEFLLQKSDVAAEDICEAQARVDDQRTLGAILVQMRSADAERIQSLLMQHWQGLSLYLFQSTNHLFWSQKQTPSKRQIIATTMPLSDLILSCDRTWIEIPSALRCLELLLSPYRVADTAAIERALQDNEKRMMHYLKRGANLSDILQDPELDRMTCYRTLFLLWLAGYLSPPQRMSETQPKERSVSPIWTRIQSIPPDWFIPLVAGVFIGVLLSPAPEQRATHPNASPKFQNLKEVIERPAWSSHRGHGEGQATENTEDTEERE
jgi:hypothetical protein